MTNVPLDTATSRFQHCFSLVVSHEGAYSDDPRDRGNWTHGKVGEGELKGTKFGISAWAYPALDIKNLTLDDARAIYHRDYWGRILGDHLPYALALATFDAAVNCGQLVGAGFLQAGLRVRVDGAIGPITLAAANKADIRAVLIEMMAQRAEYNRRAPTVAIHGLGWSRRLFALTLQAIALNEMWNA